MNFKKRQKNYSQCCCFIGEDIWIPQRKTERQKDRKTERQKERKTERQKDRKKGRQKDRKTERQKDRKTEGQKDRKTTHNAAKDFGLHRGRHLNSSVDCLEEKENWRWVLPDVWSSSASCGSCGNLQTSLLQNNII